MPVIGAQQSPIRIVTESTLKADFPADYFAIRYPNRPLAGSFKGHDFVFTQFAEVTFRKKKWRLRRIHIHRPAEHRIDKLDAADFECHLVHSEAADVELAGPKMVIGIFFHKDEKAATPPSLQKLSEALGGRSRGTADATRWLYAEAGLKLSINPDHFLPPDRTKWFHYEGSLTTGTFSEDVSWFVMKDEIGVNPSDTGDLEQHAEQEARVVHAPDRRFVLRSFA